MAGVNVEALGRSAASSFERMTGPQRITLALAFSATVMGMFLMSRITGNPPMSTLYADLDPSTAAAIVGQLDTQGIAYELADGGRRIQVPAEQVHAVRLDLSSQGLPGGGEGWSVLDDNGITTSAFDQRVGYQRAMEGELAKSIATIDGISSANVHLVIPESDLLIGDDVMASASVLLVSSGSYSITPMQVDAIVNLVSSSVEGLRPDQVSVADESGRVLAAPGDGSGVVGLEGDSQLRAKREYESLLEADLESLLAALVGPGLAVVTVAAELDFDAVTTVTESYQPTESTAGDQMMLAETTRAEIYRGEGAGDDENGTLAIEQPEVGAGGDATEVTADDDVAYSLDERDATFAVDKVITNAENAVGNVSSLSVAVLLDESAVDAGRLAEIESLVQAAAGIDAQRGDTLAVSLLPLNEQFRDTATAVVEGTEAASAGGGLDIIGLVRTVLTALVAALVIILGLRFVAKGPRRETIESLDLAELGTGAAGVSSVSEDGGGSNEPPDVTLQHLIANQSDDVAGVLRSWLSEADEVSA